jgi:hypothetical protein
MLFTSGFVLRDGSLFHLLLPPTVVSFGAASRLFAGAGVRLVTDQSYCRPVGIFYLCFFWRRYRGRVFSYAITSELHAAVFIP